MFKLKKFIEILIAEAASSNFCRVCYQLCKQNTGAAELAIWWYSFEDFFFSKKSAYASNFLRLKNHQLYSVLELS